MSQIMQEKHQKIFDLLLKYHREDPDNFFFTMRQINRANRLDEGYWFHGNDGYLVVSFWSGRDWMSKTPRISFTVWESGSTGLMLSQKDTDTDIFSEQLISKLDVHLSDKENVYGKTYDNFTIAYLDALEYFLEKDKVEIDKLVKEDKAIVPGQWMDYANSVDFISKGDFIKNLKRIEDYQKQRQLKIDDNYLKAFTVINYGLIQEIEVVDVPNGTKWIFITGENGGGKTTLLRSLAIGLCRNLDGEKIIDSESDFSIGIKISNKDFYWVHHKESDPSSFELIKGFAAYGPVRLMTESTLNDDIVSINFKEILNKLTYGLFNSFDILRDLSSHYDLGVKPKYIELEMESFLGNLEEILPNIKHIAYDHENDKLLFYDNEFDMISNNKPKTFEQLSSGTKSFAALIIDLLLKLRKQQPNVLDIANYRGIVIIDEIDIHFHPNMQKEIIVQLSDTFPKIQFIVSTHSPIPFLGAPKNTIIYNVTLDTEKGVQLRRIENVDFTNLLPNTILTSPIFGMDNLIPNSNENKSELIVDDEFSDIILMKQVERKIEELLKNKK